MNGTRMTLALGAAVLLLAGCTTAPPAPEVTATATATPPSLLPTPVAEVVVEGSTTVSAAAPFDLDIGQESGVWDVVIACRTDEPGSVEHLLDQTDPPEGTPAAQLRELPCSSPGDDGPGAGTIIFDGDVPTVLRVTSLVDADLEYRVQPHEG